MANHKCQTQCGVTDLFTAIKRHSQRRRRSVRANDADGRIVTILNTLPRVVSINGTFSPECVQTTAKLDYESPVLERATGTGIVDVGCSGRFASFDNRM